MEKVQDGWAACVNWDENPRQCAPSYVPVHSPKPGLAVSGVIIACRPTGVWTHYVDGATSPCLTHAAECPHCVKGRRPRWKCYLLYYAAGIGRIALAEITVDAFRRQPLLADSADSLRGRNIKLVRAGEAANSRVSCHISPNATLCTLPIEFDVRPILLRIWGVRSENRSAELIESSIYRVRKEANLV